MSANPEATGDDPRFPTKPWDAALAELNAAQGFEPAADEGEPVQDRAREGAEPRREATVPTAEAGQETPPPDATAATPPPAEEVRVTKREWEEQQRRLNQYGQNLQQQRAEFEARVQQLQRQQGPEWERRMADARREGERAAIQAQIAEVKDPADRHAFEQVWKDRWDREDQHLAAERDRAEAAQIRAQAEQQIQQAQQTTNYAQAQMVAAGMKDYLDGYAPTFAQKAGRLLGGEVAEDEIRAFVTRPEIVELAAQAAYQGPAAVNQFGELLARHAAVHVRDQRAAREAAAQQKREARDQSGLGRDQAGQNAGRPPADLNQYKSSKEKAGDWDAMLRALNEQQGIRVGR